MTLSDPELGPCCACEKVGADVRNIVMLDKLSPTPGKGWGCVVCGLPANGAVVVLYNACLERGNEPLFACAGYPGQDGRVPIEQLQGDFHHDLKRHREILKEDDLSFLDEPEEDDEGPIFLDDE